MTDPSDARLIVLDELIALDESEDFTREHVADSIMAMFAAAGLRVVPVVDDDTRREVKAAITDNLRAADVAVDRITDEMTAGMAASLERIAAWHHHVADLLATYVLGEADG